jgi:hypothetical protein
MPTAKEQPKKKAVTVYFEIEVVDRIEELARMYRRPLSPQIEIMIMSTLGYPVQHLLAPVDGKQ